MKRRVKKRQKIRRVRKRQRRRRMRQRMRKRRMPQRMKIIKMHQRMKRNHNPWTNKAAIHQIQRALSVTKNPSKRKRRQHSSILKSSEHQS